MERATIYRAISAPTALVGGVTALLASAWIWWRPGASETVTADLITIEFVCAWSAALVVTVAANTLFLWRGAVRGGRPFWSAGLRLAVRSILPSVVVAAAVTSATLLATNIAVPAVLSVAWIFFYGLALLATATFSPRSLLCLGWSFLAAGVLWLLFLSARFAGGITPWEGQRQATVAMAVTFGLFHLVYAACTWSQKPEPQLASE